ncbi:MAG: anti-phage defense protein ZorA [Chrysiogenetes bacterium]|nr:anti-phage defense protein ZorA [Chrysiogenetes bacterium]
MLNSVAHLLVNDLFVWVYCGAIVTIALALGITLRRHYRSLLVQLTKAVEVVEKTDGEAGFAANFDSVSDEIDQLPDLQHSWDEFTECLIDRPRPGQEDVYRNSREAALYFNDYSIIVPKIDLRFYSAIPNALTGFGILGTFLGLAAGIAIASPQLSPDNMDATMQGLKSLLSGASLAFLTSIAGLITSLVFLGFERHWVSTLQKKLAAFVNALDERLQLVTPEWLADAALTELENQTRSLQNFSNDLAVTLSGQMEEVLVKKSLGPALERLISATEGMREDRGESNNEMIQQIVDKFSESITGSAGSEMKAMAGTLSGLQETLQSAASSIRGNQEEMQNATRQVAESVRAALSDSSRVMQEELTGTLSSILNRIEQSSSAVAERLQSAGADTASTISGTLDSLSTSLKSSIDSINQNQEEMRRATKEVSDSVAAAMSQSSQSVQEQLTTAMSEMLARIGESSSGLAEQLRAAGQGAAQEMNGTIAAFAEGMSRLNSSTEGTGELVAELKTTVTQLRELSSATGSRLKEFGDLVTPISESARNFKESADVTQQAMTATQRLTESLQASVIQAKETQEKLEAVWRGYESRFSGVDESLRKVFVQLDEGLNRYTIGVRDFMGTLDDQTAKVSKDLAGAVSELRQAVEEMSEVMEHRS